MCVGAGSIAGCSSDADDQPAPQTDWPVLDFAWTEGGATHRLVATADGQVITADGTSRTGYLQRVVSPRIVDDAARRAGRVLGADQRTTCTESESGIDVSVSTGRFSWHYELSGSGARGCWPALDSTISEIADDLTRGTPRDYAGQVAVIVGAAYRGATRPWPLDTDLSEIAIKWSDHRRIAGCVVVPSSTVTRFTGPDGLTVRNTEAASGPTDANVRTVVLLPGENLCDSGAAIRPEVRQTIGGLAPNDTVIDLRTQVLQPGLGAPRVLVRADGSAIVDDDSSPTGYVIRRLTDTQTAGLVQATADVLRNPKGEEVCGVLDGVDLSAEFVTDQQVWEGSRNNPGPCGWPELADLADLLKDRLDETGAATTPAQMPG